MQGVWRVILQNWVVTGVQGVWRVILQNWVVTGIQGAGRRLGKGYNLELL